MTREPGADLNGEAHSFARGVTGTWWPHRLRPRDGVAVQLDLAQWVQCADVAASKDDLSLFSLATFREGVRSLATHVASHGLVFDVDHVGPVPLASLAVLPGIETHAYTSWSHTAEDLCARVMMPLSRAVSAHEHARLWPVVAAAFSERWIAVDPKCKDASRGYYVPAARRGEFLRYQWHTTPGAPLDVDALLARAPVAPTPVVKAYQPTGQSSAYLRGAIRGIYADVAGAPKGGRNHALFVGAMRLIDLGLAHEVEPLLLEAGAACGLSVGEIRKTIASAMKGAAA